MVRYQLFTKFARDNVDLRDYEYGLKKALYCFFDDVEMVVRQQYYELSRKLSPYEARQFGRCIVRFCPNLRNYIKVYYNKKTGKVSSRHLFMKKVVKKNVQA